MIDRPAPSTSAGCSGTSRPVSPSSPASTPTASPAGWRSARSARCRWTRRSSRSCPTRTRAAGRSSATRVTSASTSSAPTRRTVCRTFAVSGGDKFAELAWHPAGSGVADPRRCAGLDRLRSRGRPRGRRPLHRDRPVRELDVGWRPRLPLVFFQGGYGRFSSLSLAAWECDLALQMRSADLARPHMEALAEELEVECVASAVVGSDMVLLARAGQLESAIAADRGRSADPVRATGRHGVRRVGAGVGAEGVARSARQERRRRRRSRRCSARSPRCARPATRSGAVTAGTREAAQVHVAPRPDAASGRDDRAAAPADRHAAAGLRVAGRRAADDARTVSTPVFGPGGVVVMVLSAV